MTDDMDYSQSNILRIKDHKTLHLIDLYRREECLWNTLHCDYKKREKRARAARRIAALLNIPNFEPRHVLSKFRNIRNSYSQELKKIAHSRTQLDFRDEYTPKVFWFTKLDSFLRPHLKSPREGAVPGGASAAVPGRVSTAVPSRVSTAVPGGVSTAVPGGASAAASGGVSACDDATTQDNLIYLVKGNEKWVQLKNLEELQPDSNVVEQSADINESEERTQKRKLNPYANDVGSKRAKVVDSDPESDGECEQKTVTQTLKEISSRLHVLMSHNGDYYDSFGKYVASLLRTLPPRKAFELQPEIISLITSAGMEMDIFMPDDDSNHSHMSTIKIEKTEDSANS